MQVFLKIIIKIDGLEGTHYIYLRKNVLDWEYTFNLFKKLLIVNIPYDTPVMKPDQVKKVNL